MQIVFYAHWSEHEEFGAILILEDDDGNLFLTECGHSVYDDVNRNDWSTLTPIDYEQAIEKMDDWSEHYDSDITDLTLVFAQQHHLLGLQNVQFDR